MATAEYKLHWHVLLTHFPLSLLGVAFLFQVLHLYLYPDCFEMASSVVFVAGVASLLPATLSGYLTWKGQYHGAKATIFRRKTAIAVALLLAGVPLGVWRIVTEPLPEASRPGIHWPYFVGTTLMIAGALLEGYFGGQLSHRPRVQFQKHDDNGSRGGAEGGSA